EPTAGGDRPGSPAIADPLVRDRDVVDHCRGHAMTLPLEIVTGKTAAFAETFIVDADSHWCEPPDLYTSIAPEKYKDRVPRVEEIDGEPMWVMDGHPLGRHSAGGVIGRDGKKEEADIALFQWGHEMV